MATPKPQKRHLSYERQAAIKTAIITAITQHKRIWFSYYDDEYEAIRTVCPLKFGVLTNDELAMEAWDEHDKKRPLKLYRMDGMDAVDIIEPVPPFTTVPGIYKDTDQRFKELLAVVRLP